MKTRWCYDGQTCCASEDGDEHPCCVHEPKRRNSRLGAVCCWCGCCYIPQPLHRQKHGKYRVK